jgi:hypothetical protein
MPDPCFVTFRLRDAKKTIRNINPFCLERALENTAGTVKNVSSCKGQNSCHVCCKIIVKLVCFVKSKMFILAKDKIVVML